MSFNPLNVGFHSKGSAVALTTTYVNGSAIDPIPQGTMCSVKDSSGQIIPIDVSSDTSVNSRVGLAESRIPTSSVGPVITNGRLENFTTAYPIGTPLFVGTDGAPTNIVPSIGVNGFLAGYAVIFLGIIVPNEKNPGGSKDIQLMVQFIGDL